MVHRIGFIHLICIQNPIFLTVYLGWFKHNPTFIHQWLCCLCNFLVRIQVESRQISLSPNPAGYFTPSHHLTSYYLIRAQCFWQAEPKPAHLLYVGTWQQSPRARQETLWHKASLGRAILSSLNEDHPLPSGCRAAS